jgi:hypothetical protein
MNTNRFPFPHTTAALLVAVTVLMAAVFLDIDVLPGIDFMDIERREAGEVSVGFLMIIPALLVDGIVWRQRQYYEQLRAERLRVVKVTMRTVQDIVNNALNQLQLIRIEAETHDVPQDVLALFDETIRGTAVKLKDLGDLETYVETQMDIGSALVSGAQSH